MYKVPRRQIYVNNVSVWFRAILWVFAVKKLWPDARCDYY